MPQTLMATSHEQSSPINDHKRQVRYIYKLLTFIDWKKDSTPSNGINICSITSNTLFQKEIQKLKGKSSKWGRINVRLYRISPSAQTLRTNCNIVYSDQTKNYQLFKSALKTKGIVSISKTNGLPMEYSIFRFVEVNNKLRFKINLSLAKKNHIIIRSSLLNIAIEVI